MLKKNCCPFIIRTPKPRFVNFKDMTEYCNVPLLYTIQISPEDGLKHRVYQKFCPDHAKRVKELEEKECEDKWHDMAWPLTGSECPTCHETA